MQHEHSKLVQAWLDDNSDSVEFEFAYGTGVDFTWHDCDVSYLISNPNVQARIKIKPKKEKRWIGCYPPAKVTPISFASIDQVKNYVSKISLCTHCAPEAWQFIEIEIEVK